jgi:hypothetical protein
MRRKVEDSYMKEWQKVFLRGVGLGFGGAIALAAVALSIHWFSSRPKSWDLKAISCVSAKAGPYSEYDPQTRKLKTLGFSLEFALANNTSRDYTVSQNLKLYKRLAATGALEEFSGKLEHGFLIPARDRAQITIDADYKCGILDLATGDETERDEATCYRDAFGDVIGFVALDEGNKIEISLPKPAPPTTKN